MTPEDQLILAQQDMKTLAKWWCILNRWEWPDELPNPESPTADRPGRRWNLMKWISEAIGFRECSREWNRDMSDEEFNDFWRGTFEGHRPSRDRYERWLRQKVRS